MKVVKQPHEETPVVLPCSKCSAVLEIEKDDCTFRPAQGGDEDYWGAKCPCCGHEVTIDPRIVNWRINFYQHANKCTKPIDL
mgnify:CR=1 FL=1